MPQFLFRVRWKPERMQFEFICADTTTWLSPEEFGLMVDSLRKQPIQPGQIGTVVLETADKQVHVTMTEISHETYSFLLDYLNKVWGGYRQHCDPPRDGQNRTWS